MTAPPDLRFVVLGSGTGLPDPARGAAGFVVQHGARSWWVDGGPGTLQRSARAGVDPLTLHGGVLSHLHPDHAADLTALLFARRVAGVTTPYHLVGARGVQAHVDALRDVWGDALDTPLVVTELPDDAPGVHDLGGVRLRTAPAAHGAHALHLRFEAGGTAVVFSGDTGPSEALVGLATGADLFVCECALVDGDPYPRHLSAAQVADAVQVARPREVWLTHLYPDVDPERAVATVAATGVPTRRAADGDVWPRQRSASEKRPPV